MTPEAKIFYVEDDITLSYITKENLELNGYITDYYEDGEKALKNFMPGKYDICILDIMLPKIDGFTLAKEIRKIDHNVPIIFLTAKSSKDDKITGLKTGADDYITKPFSMEELTLKIKVFLKRNKVLTIPISEKKLVPIGKFIFDYYNLQLELENQKIALTHKEAELIKLFIENKNQLIKRENILQKIWGDNDYFLGRSLDVFISRLRKMFKADDNIKIENVHGIGFKFKV